MVEDTDKTVKQVILENPGIPLEQEIYAYCNNKIPVHTGAKDLKHKPRKQFNSIAIKTYNHDYMCIDFDGYSAADDEATQKQEKQVIASIIKENFIPLLDEQTKKYRIDKTASNKFHVWLKQPNVPNKEFLKMDKFLTSDGVEISNDIVEIFSKFTKHNVHLAGSTITENDKIVGAYENVYAGASFDEMDSVANVKGLLISAITSAGYLVKIENPIKVTNTVRFNFLDASHNGTIKEFHRDNKLYFSYLESQDIMVSKDFYVVSKTEFSISHIMEHCQDEYKSILCSIYYYHNSKDDLIDKDTEKVIENQETSNQLIQVYKNHWQNTRGKRHTLMLATSHVLIKYLNFNDTDLDFFFDELDDAVNGDIDHAHRNTIKEGLEHHADKEYGIPTIIDILGCKQQELNFLSSNNDIQNELEYVERIKPTITSEIIDDENKFKKIQQLQLKDHYNGLNTYIKIEPTNSTTDLIAQILSNSLYNEKDNIAKFLLALIGVVIGTNRTYIVISGVSSGGKSALVKTVKQVIPASYKTQLDDLSDAAFTRHTENKGKYAYNRMIIDYGDKGNIKGYEKAIEEMARFQNLITEGVYSYRVTDKQNNNPKGTKDLLIVTDGFAQIITTTKDVLAKIDEQIITRSEILYVGNNSKNDISDFNAELGKENVKKQVKSITKVIQSHILYNLNKYNNTDDIIVLHWRKYITNLLKANGGVNREIDATMNALKTYSWLEIDRIHQVKGTDGRIYYIPSSAIVEDFIKIYGVKSDKHNNTDKELIKAITDEYDAQDDVIYDGNDLNTQGIRKELNVFTYQDIESLLKNDEHKELYNKINNVSDILRKLEKTSILARLPDSTSQRKVIYYIKAKALSYNKELEILPITDDDIENAIQHLKYHEVITDDDTDAALYGKGTNKFAHDTDFSFIDQRNVKQDAPGKDTKNDDNDDDLPGNVSVSSSDTNAAAPGNDAIIPGNSSIQDTKSAVNSQVIDERTSSNKLVNLHCHTDESVGDGAVSIEKLIDTAIFHEQKALALTNHGTLNGLYKFNQLCHEKGIKPILGIEAYISKNRYHLVLLAKNYQGYQDLLKLHNKNVEYMKSNGLNRSDKYVNGGIFYSNIEQDKELLKNIIGLSGCVKGEIPQLLLNDRYDDAKALAMQYNAIFNKFYLELQYNGFKKQEILNEMLIELSNDTGIPLTVTGDVHYISNKDDWNAIKYAHRKGNHAPESNNPFMTAAPKQLAETTIDIADSIAPYNINTSLHIPKPSHNREWLKPYCYNRLKELNIDDTEHRQRLEQELTVIKDEIADYVILLYEIVDTIKDVAGAIGGRGSAIGSLVCYLLGFHEVDPLKYGLLFERFLNVERIEKALNSDSIDTSLLPDIDLNIADDKRNAVFTVLENKYEYIAKVMSYHQLKAENEKIKEIHSLYPTADVIDLKYNLSVHAGGIILSTESFNDYLPVTLTKDNEIVTDCDLTEIESRGGIKYDLLGESSSKINEGIILYDDEINDLVQYIKQHPIGISQFTGYSLRKYLRTHNIETLNDIIVAIGQRNGNNESWLFQEDMMLEATKYGITFADADYIRKPRGNEQEKQEKLDKIIQVMKNNGCTEKDAELFRTYHSGYSFPKAHAVGYTLESLKNAKLKRDNTALFFEKKLNHVGAKGKNKQPNKIKIAELFDDAIKLGVEIIAPSREYYDIDAKAVGNKLYVGTKFIDGIGANGPVSKGKFIKEYKEYLKKSDIERLYSIGTYDNSNLPNELISLGYLTKGNNVTVATISDKGFCNIWFNKPKYCKPKDLFFKGAIITDEIIESYLSV